MNNLSITNNPMIPSDNCDDEHLLPLDNISEDEAKAELIRWSLKNTWRPQCLLNNRLLNAGFKHSEVWRIVQIVDSLCMNCFDRYKEKCSSQCKKRNNI